MANRPILTISILASRNKEQIVRCLNSLHLIADEIPTELILTDTSKSPEIHELLLSYTDLVFEFDWCDDFSKARNLGLEKASGEWFLYLDDDEWFEDAKEIVDFFKSGDYKKYACANYIQRNYHDMALEIYSDSWVSRIIRKSSKTHFESKIHEYLAPQEGEGKNLHAVVGHTGYIFQTREDKLKHFKRNEPLLRAMAEEEPDNMRWRVHLLQEYHTVSDWKNTVICAEKALGDFNGQGDVCFNRDIGSIYAFACKAHLQMEEFNECLGFIQKALADSRCQETCLGYLWLLMAECFVKMKRYEKVPECINAYFELCQALKKNKVRFENQQGGLLTGEAFSDLSQKKAFALIIMAGLYYGTAEALTSYFDKLEWNKTSVYVPDGMFDALAYGAATIDDVKAMRRPLEITWSHKALQNDMFAACAKVQELGDKAYTHMLQTLSYLDVDHWFIQYAKLSADMELSNEEIKEIFDSFKNQISNILLTPPDIKARVRAAGINFEEAYLKSPTDKFIEQVHDYVNKLSLDEILEEEKALRACGLGDQFVIQYFWMRLGERKFYKIKDFEGMRAKRECIVDFSSRVCYFYRTFYSEVTSKNPQELPDFAKAALFLEHALAMEEKDPELSKESFKDAREACPSYRDLILTYQNSCPICEEDRQFEAILEMRRLKKKILSEVRLLKEAKKYEEAMSILNQYHAMREPDLESQSLKLELMLEASKEGIDLTKRKVVLSIALMVSNRKDTVPRCIESLEPIRKAIPCELIVLDTGCDADLRAYLESKADVVESFTWCKDFSKARNETLKYATGEWYMYLDDDEWFTDAEELIQFFTSGEYKNYGHASYIQRNYLDMQGNQWSDSWVSRMAENLPDLHFESKIHEYMQPLNGNCKGLRSVVDHYGYVFETEEDLLAHTERNVSLLKEMIEEEPDNIRWHVQLIQEYRKVNDPQMLWDTSYHALRRFENFDNENAYNHFCALYAGCIYAAKEATDYEKEIEMCLLALDDPRCSELLKAFISLNMAEALYCQARIAEAELHKLEETVEVPASDWDTVVGMYNNAIAYVGEFLKWKDFFDDNEPILYLQSGTAFLGECFDDVMVKKAYSVRMASELLQGITTHFEADFDKLEWDKEYIYIYEDFMEPILEAMCFLGKQDCFVKALPVMYKHKGLWEYLVKVLTEMEQMGMDVTGAVRLIQEVVPEALGY